MSANGIKPNSVVSNVRKIGRNVCAQALIIRVITSSLDLEENADLKRALILRKISKNSHKIKVLGFDPLKASGLPMSEFDPILEDLDEIIILDIPTDNGGLSAFFRIEEENSFSGFSGNSENESDQNNTENNDNETKDFFV